MNRLSKCLIWHNSWLALNAIVTLGVLRQLVLLRASKLQFCKAKVFGQEWRWLGVEYWALPTEV